MLSVNPYELLKRQFDVSAANNTVIILSICYKFKQQQKHHNQSVKRNQT